SAPSSSLFPRPVPLPALPSFPTRRSSDLTIESGVAKRRPVRIWVGVALLLVGIAIAVAPSFSSGKATYVVGAKSFSEQYILADRSEEHTSELQSRGHLVCRLLLEKKKTKN